MGDMGTVIPAGFLVAKQIREDHQSTPFSSVVHVGDISYAGTGSKDEIAVSLKKVARDFFQINLLPRLGSLGCMGTASRTNRIDSTIHDECGESRGLLQLHRLS